MKVLVLGGTQFVGRHIVEALLASGHGVSILTRGVSPGELPSGVERLRGDRDKGASGLAALAGRMWDACVDVSGYSPWQVRPSVELLRARVARYVFISAVSVYGDSETRPVLETHPRIPPAREEPDDIEEITNEVYGSRKVACEDIVQEIFGDRSVLLRPQGIVGPWDPRGRYAYWIQRTERSGEMLAPGDGSDHIQVIDARDVARFVSTAIERGPGGAYNMAGPRFTWASFMEMLGAQNVVWVPNEILESAGITFNELPLFRPESRPRSSLMHVSSERAQAAGLALMKPEDSLRDVREWTRSREPVAGLSGELERALIAQVRNTRG